MLTRRRKIALLAALAIVLLGSVVYMAVRKEREPSYQGKTLSEWAHVYAFPTFPGQKEVAAGAIRHIGTNAIPFLMHWLAIESRGIIERGLEQGSAPGLRPQAVDRWLLSNQTERATRLRYAFESFRALGPIAAPAIPTLERDAGHENWASGMYSLEALNAIGIEALPALRRLADNPTVPIQTRFAAEVAIEQWKRTPSAIPTNSPWR